jgi:hypothetical protein
MIFVRHNMMIIGRSPSLHPHPAKITKCGCRTGVYDALGFVIGDKAFRALVLGWIKFNCLRLSG